MLARMWSNRNSHSLLMRMQNATAALEDSLVVSYKTKNIVTIGSQIMPLGLHPNELKTYVHAKTCTQMFPAALFLIAKTWKQPRCPSVGEWIDNLWSIQTIEYYSSVKRNELSSFEKTWKKLTRILLSERN